MIYLRLLENIMVPQQIHRNVSTIFCIYKYYIIPYIKENEAQSRQHKSRQKNHCQWHWGNFNSDTRQFHKCQQTNNLRRSQDNIHQDRKMTVNGIGEISTVIFDNSTIVNKPITAYHLKSIYTTTKKKQKKQYVLPMKIQLSRGKQFGSQQPV